MINVRICYPYLTHYVLTYTQLRKSLFYGWSLGGEGGRETQKKAIKIQKNQFCSKYFFFSIIFFSYWFLVYFKKKFLGSRIFSRVSSPLLPTLVPPLTTVIPIRISSFTFPFVANAPSSYPIQFAAFFIIQVSINFIHHLVYFFKNTLSSRRKN